MKTPNEITDDTGAKDPDTWGETLISDDEGLPLGRMYERYVYSSDRKACELRIFKKNDSDEYNGFVDMNNIIVAADKQSAIDFLVDWAGLNPRSF